VRSDVAIQVLSHGISLRGAANGLVMFLSSGREHGPHVPPSCAFSRLGGGDGVSSAAAGLVGAAGRRGSRMNASWFSGLGRKPAPGQAHRPRSSLPRRRRCQVEERRMARGGIGTGVRAGEAPTASWRRARPLELRARHLAGADGRSLGW
jgi:hypothetical protein